MTNASLPEEITRLASFNSLMLNATNQTCLDFKYSKMIGEMSNVSWEASASEGGKLTSFFAMDLRYNICVNVLMILIFLGRQWTFQTCNEFGFFQTSNKKPQIFGNKFSLDFSIKQCADLFGSKFNGSYLEYATDRTNILYGALDIEVRGNIFSI